MPQRPLYVRSGGCLVVGRSAAGEASRAGADEVRRGRLAWWRSLAARMVRRPGMEVRETLLAARRSRSGPVADLRGVGASWARWWMPAVQWACLIAGSVEGGGRGGVIAGGSGQIWGQPGLIWAWGQGSTAVVLRVMREKEGMEVLRATI